MVDEELNVYTIDFPQMISTSHPDAEFYFERDQTCIHTIFNRKYQYTSGRKYKLTEIEIIRNIDIDVKASGYDKTAKNDALENYLSQIRKTAGDGNEGGNMDADDEGGEEVDGGNMDDDDDHADNGEGMDDDVDELGDIEEEMKAMNVEVDKVEGGQKDGQKVEGDEEGAEESEDGEGEEEEVDWEARLEKRQQMKALKKEKMANKPAKTMMMKIDKTDKKDGDDSKDSDDSEEENELIKKAIKRKYRKKKVIKSKKNHPKIFNAAVKDQMAGFK